MDTWSVLHIDCLWRRYSDCKLVKHRVGQHSQQLAVLLSNDVLVQLQQP